jgi:hypothetical protein
MKNQNTWLASGGQALVLIWMFVAHFEYGSEGAGNLFVFLVWFRILQNAALAWASLPDRAKPVRVSPAFATATLYFQTMLALAMVYVGMIVAPVFMLLTAIRLYARRRTLRDADIKEEESAP